MSRDRDRLAVAARLSREGLAGEAQRLERCGEKALLGCKCCGRSLEITRHCKRKWCPVCAAIRADEAEARFGPIVEKLRSPLFLTLTSAHNVHDDPGALIPLYIASIKRFRALRWFKMAVRGGVGAIEVSTPAPYDSKGAPLPFHGYHVHYHALVDCDWLSVTVDAPRRGASRREVKMKAEASMKEVAVQWGLCLGSDRVSVFVRRPTPGTLREVLKYTVSTDSLLDERVALAPLIQAMAGAKMRAPWGSVRKMHTALVKEGEANKVPTICECGAEAWLMAPGLPAPALDDILRRPRSTTPPLTPDHMAKVRSSSTESARFVRLQAKALPGCEALARADTIARIAAQSQKPRKS